MEEETEYVMEIIDSIIITCLALLVVISGAEITSASDRLPIYIAGLEGRDCQWNLVRNGENGWLESLRISIDSNKYNIINVIEAGSVVFHGGGSRIESLYITSDSKYGIKFAVTGLIEGKKTVESGVKYRIIVRIIGNHEDGIIVNCESPYVDEIDINSCMRKTIERAIVGMDSWLMRNIKKAEYDTDIKTLSSVDWLNPYIMFGASMPLNSFGEVCGLGKGILIGDNIGCIPFSDTIKMFPSVRLSMFCYSLKKSNVESLRLSRMMIGCSIGYSFKYLMVGLSQYFGYQLGRMRFQSTEGGNYRTKYYHAPVMDLSSLVAVPYGNCDFMFGTSYVLFREKGNTCQEVSFSTGGVYRL